MKKLFTKRKLFLSAIIPAFMLFGIFAIVTPTANAQSDKPQTVDSVDLKRYTGKWYEIAHYPNKFQKDCVSNTTATYSLQKDGDITVLNTCKEKNGEIKTAEGEAKVKDEATNAKLKVRFAPKFLSFLPFVWGDYWIIDLDEDYQYSVVGDSKREYLWILSREPQLSDETYQTILKTVESKGFDKSKLVKTVQN